MYLSFFAININYSVIYTKNVKMCCSCFGLELLIYLQQGAKKVSFTEHLPFEQTVPST